MDNGKIKYPVGEKHRKCTLRNCESNKSNWLHAIGHVASKHPGRKYNKNEFCEKRLKSNGSIWDTMKKLAIAKNC